MEIKLMETLETDTGIIWWDRNRNRVNEVINAFNDWQLIHRFNEFEKEVIKAKIKLCYKFGEENNFSDWQFELLDEMKQFITYFEEEKCV